MKESVFSNIDLDDHLTKDIAHISTVSETGHQITYTQFIPNVIAIELNSESQPENRAEKDRRCQTTPHDSQDNLKMPLSSGKSKQFFLKKETHDESNILVSLRCSLLNSYNGYSRWETDHLLFATGEKWNFRSFFKRLFNG